MDGANGFGFADGHVESHIWKTTALTSVPYTPGQTGSYPPVPGGINNTDWIWMTNHSACKLNNAAMFSWSGGVPPSPASASLLCISALSGKLVGMNLTKVPIDISDPLNARILTVSEDKIHGFQREPMAEIARLSGVDLPVVIERVQAMLRAGAIRR